MKTRLFAALMLVYVVGLADTHYVRSPETCTNTILQFPYGSWETAATCIQWAVDAASADDVVLVSNGVYRAADTSVNVVEFKTNITMCSVNGPAQTIIDGEGTRRCAWIKYSSTISGFTLSNGFAACGAGLYALDTSATITNCIIVNNVCTGIPASYLAGAGVALWGGNPLVVNCRIANNVCLAGDTNYSSAYGGGGGICMSGGIVCATTIVSNYADYTAGGGILLWRRGEVLNCDIIGNKSAIGGGMRAYSGPFLVRDCTISNNIATNYGAGAYIEGGSFISNCVSSNTAFRYAGLYLTGGALVSNCIVCLNTNWHTTTWPGAGVVMIDATGALVTDCIISGNVNFTGSGGGVYAHYASNRLERCTVCNNSAPNGGGVYVTATNNSNAVISDCLIRGNIACGAAGGVYMNTGGILRNSLVCGNFASNYSAGVYALNTAWNSGMISACTIVDNHITASVSYAAGLYVQLTNNIINCIIASNRMMNGSVKNVYLARYGGESTSIYYSCAGELTAERGNITNAPVFVDFSAGDYRLRPYSPGVNAGTNETWMVTGNDFAGSARIDRFSGRVDMGCYEYLLKGSLLIVH